MFKIFKGYDDIICNIWKLITLKQTCYKQLTNCNCCNFTITSPQCRSSNVLLNAKCQCYVISDGRFRIFTRFEGIYVRRIWPICAFGQSYQQWQNANEIRQMRAHLANCAAHLPKCAAHLVNPTDSDQMCTQFVKCARIWPIALLAKCFQNKTTYARPLFTKRNLNGNVYQVVAVNASKF